MARIEMKECLYNRTMEAELFSRRFGSFSKNDYEVLMFTVYLDSLRVPARDYEISVDLGITESKVRNLRVKSQLMYPKKIDWTNELVKSLKQGSYDPVTRQVTIMFEDPSIQNYMRNEIEKSFNNVGKTFNSKQLVLPIESFMLLAAIAEENPDKVIGQLNARLQKETKSIKKIEGKAFKVSFLKAVPDVSSFISNCLSIYTMGRPIIENLLQLIQV